MENLGNYRCVNCGHNVKALYRTYGPSVIKLTKCEKCKGIVDKYIEYDPVIVMIDLVLVSREAQRHVIYNIEFKSCWKLFIILVMLETYGHWRNDSLFTMGINHICGVPANDTMYLGLPSGKQLPESWNITCTGWLPGEKTDETDLFIWEKDFYILFVSTFTGIVAFMLTVHSSMNLVMPNLGINEGETLLWGRAWRVLRGVCVSWCVGGAGGALRLAASGWADGLRTRAVHDALLHFYCGVIFTSLYSVVYDCPLAITSIIVTAAGLAKYSTLLYAVPLLRSLIS